MMSAAIVRKTTHSRNENRSLYFYETHTAKVAITVSTTLVQALQNPQLYPHTVRAFRVLETHISWVVLTGVYAYKIKKPVNLGFLDFSTLEQREHFCHEELRLNRRFAPQLYLEVVSIRGTLEQPRFDGTEPVIEYAVKMLEFDQQQRVDSLLANNELGIDTMDQFAADLAALHAQASQASQASHETAYGTAKSVWAPMEENFVQIRSAVPDLDVISILEKLEHWCCAEFTRQRELLTERKRGGGVRECHGDLHTRNLVRIDGRILAFDCLEFNANLRWIDVISEIAFLMMDLEACGRSAYAWRFINRYLEHSGDYPGVTLLPLYLTYRALVRAKVACLQASPESHAEFQHYLALAQRYTTPSKPFLIIMQGLSGSGKSTLSQRLADQLGLIRVRSDVERKRMFALDPYAVRSAALESVIYTASVTDSVYRHLATLAQSLLTAGYSTVLDATFLLRVQRDLLRNLAQRLRVPFVILRCHAPNNFLKHAITQRARAGGDASDADVQVLQRQIASQEPLDGTEIAEAIELDVSVNFDVTTLEQRLRRRVDALSSPGFQ